MSFIGGGGVGPYPVLRKTITFTGAAGAGAVGQVTVATPTGLVLVKSVIPRCTTDLTGATATLTLGQAASVAALIAVTVATTIDAGQYWVSNAPGATLLALPAALQGFLLATPLTLDVLVAAVTAGVLTFDIEYQSINGGSLA